MRERHCRACLPMVVRVSAPRLWQGGFVKLLSDPVESAPGNLIFKIYSQFLCALADLDLILHLASGLPQPEPRRSGSTGIASRLFSMFPAVKTKSFQGTGSSFRFDYSNSCISAAM